MGLAKPAYGRPVHVRLVQTTALHFDAAARKHPGSPSASRLEAYRHARTPGGFFTLYPGAPGLARAGLAHDIRRGLCHVPGCSPPRGRRLRAVSIAPIPEDRAFSQDAPFAALHRGEYLPASSGHSFRVCAYLESWQPSASAAGSIRATRYDAHRFVAALGEY